MPILGVVENMSYFKCSECDTQHHIFGRDLDSKLRGSVNAPIIGRLPIKPNISDNCDKGTPSVVGDSEISKIFDDIVEHIIPALQWSHG